MSKLYVFLVLALISCLAHLPYDAVDLRTVRTLVFKRDAYTTNAGRGTSVPQLQCLQGPCQHTPSTIVCENIGINYGNGDPNWKCSAQLVNGVRLGKTDVSCEGYSSRNDPLVRADSCALDFTLEIVPVKQVVASSNSDIGPVVVFMLLFGGLVMCLCLASEPPTNTRYVHTYPTPYVPTATVYVPQSVPAPVVYTQPAVATSVSHGTTTRREAMTTTTTSAASTPSNTPEAVSYGTTKRRG